MDQIRANRQRPGRFELLCSYATTSRNERDATRHTFLVPQPPPVMATEPPLDIGPVLERVKANMVPFTNDLTIRRECFHASSCHKCNKHIRESHPSGPVLAKYGYPREPTACPPFLDLGANLRRCKPCGLAYYCVRLVPNFQFMSSATHCVARHAYKRYVAAAEIVIRLFNRVKSARNKTGQHTSSSAMALRQKTGTCSKITEKKWSSATSHSRSSATRIGSRSTTSACSPCETERQGV